MATTKSVKYAAPYRSKTFNDNQSELLGLNGVVAGGRVTTSGPVVSVQPLTFVQNGQFVTTDYVASATLPAGLVAPYSVVMTTSSTVEILAEVITPTFAQRPQDISVNSVIVADWDGYEWVSRPKLQISERIASQQNYATKQDSVGVSQGFDVSVVGPNVTLSDGTLVDQQGFLFTKGLGTSLPWVAQDPNSYDRVDEIVYRRPDDSASRSGSLKYVVGQSFVANSSLSIVNKLAYGTASKVHTMGKILVDASTGNNLVFFIEDYGSRADLTLAKTDETNTTVAVGTPLLASNVSDFDAIYNPSGSIDLVYVRGMVLYHKRVTTAGAVLVAETAISTHAQTLANPRIVSIKSGTTYFMHIVYELHSTVLDHKLYYMRLSSASTIETTPVVLVSLSALIANPSIDKDDDDSVLYLAYENQTTSRIYLREYDASTAGGATPPSLLGGTLELQDDTYQVSTLTVEPASGASNPIVKRSDNKHTFVFWKHTKGITNGLAVYSSHYLDTFGHKAVIADLVTPTEDLADFAVSVDSLNVAHVSFNLTAVSLYKSSFKLEDLSPVGVAGVVDSVATTSAIASCFNKKGALIHGWSEPSAGVTNNGAVPSPTQAFGPGVFGTDPIASNEFVLFRLTGNPFSPGYDDLPTVPALGDSIVITGAPNAGTYNWTGVRIITYLAVDYAVVATDAVFTYSVAAATAQFRVQSGAQYTLAKTTAGVSSNMRSFTPLHTDVFLAHYRSSDSVLAVSGPPVEETLTLRRLYEYLTCFPGGGGTASWQTAGPNILTFDGAFSINFFNRNATYTIAAAPLGITISNNQVAYVQIPDEDSGSALTLQIATYGSGILDRYGRNVYPLFWNTGGTLYTRFIPYRLSSGETIIVGDQMSQQMISWLGSTTSTPNPAAHGYSSIAGAGLLQSDSILTAIGKLDAAVGLVEGGTVTLLSGTTSKVITFASAKASATYSPQVTLLNSVDATPQFQPLDVIARTTTTMTVAWNAPLDTANYSIAYIVKA